MNFSIGAMGQIPQAGSLYVVATPIGNLADISLRALSILQSVDVICAEDTRVTQHLLSAYGIKVKNLVSIRAQNEMQMAKKVCQWLAEGLSVAQVSDAGTPGICDPGSRLVKVVRQAGFSVYSIPGACALIGALSILGTDISKFTFMGFFPIKKTERYYLLDEIVKHHEAIVCYEAPHRILSTLDDIVLKIPNRNVFLVRELTKTFETVLAGTASEIRGKLLLDTHQQKGEMVIIFDKLNYQRFSSISPEIKELADELAISLPIKRIINLLSNVADFNKRELYTYLLTKKNKEKNNDG